VNQEHERPESKQAESTLLRIIMIRTGQRVSSKMGFWMLLVMEGICFKTSSPALRYLIISARCRSEKIRAYDAALSSLAPCPKYIGKA
jgi:hypothetical protein